MTTRHCGDDSTQNQDSGDGVVRGSSARRPRGAFGGSLFALVWLASSACGDVVPGTAQPDSAQANLKVPAAPVPEPRVQQTVYVPVYSSIYHGLGIRGDEVELTATVSVRNVSARHPLVLTYARYYNSAGTLVRNYLDQPSQVEPLATVEFVVNRDDTTGGAGANFLIQWVGPADIDVPLIESVMIGHAGNAGISFTSAGRPIMNAPEQ